MNVAFQADTANQTPVISAIRGVDGGGDPGNAQLFGGLVQAFGAAQASLEHARGSEQAFAAGGGGLQEMVFDRARADAILNVASAAASKATQSLNTILNMQV